MRAYHRRRPMPWNAAELHVAQAMWIGNRPAEDICTYLGIEDPRHFYNLRRDLHWPPRPNRRKRAGSVTYTYTPEEAEQARVRWYEKAGAKELMKLLHLGNRSQVYLVAKREGWTARPRRKGANARFLDQIQAALPSIPNRAELARIDATKPDDVRPRHVPRACPECSFTVLPDTEYSTWVGDELYHTQCAPRKSA